MNRTRLSYAALALVTAVALSACKKEEPAPPPAVVTPAPMPAPAPPMPAAAATASVTSVDLGNAVDATGKVTTPMMTFGKKDTINASVSTMTSDPAATVAGTIGARWTFGDNTPVKEDSKTFDLAGPGVTNFQIVKPDGWPVGKYKLEVMLDGAVVQTKEFEVK